MKKLCLLKPRFLTWAFVLFWVSVRLDVASQTTTEEYLYVTFGYKEQLQKGLDDKKGYAWKPLSQHQFPYKKSGFLNSQYQTGVFDFEGLYRNGETRPCAIVAIFRERQGLHKKDGTFVCIPHLLTDKDIQTKAEKYLLEEARFSENVFQQYSIGLGKLAIKLANP